MQGRKDESRGMEGCGKPRLPHITRASSIEDSKWMDKGQRRGGAEGGGKLCRGHLGCDGPLALQLRLVLLKRLLPTALEILAVVMLGHPVL